LRFLIEFNFYLRALTNLFIPEDYAINPLVADPALVLFVSKHLPLAATRHIILVADPSLEYQFRLIISHQLAASAVPVDALGIEISDLFLLLDLRGLDALSYRLINRKLKTSDWKSITFFSRCRPTILSKATLLGLILLGS